MIKALLKLGMPIILSQGILTLMVLCDRFILSLKNPIFAAAATTGGFTAISLSLFFVNFLSFATSLIARRLGSGQKDGCHTVVAQTLILAFVFTPLLISLASFGPKYFAFLGHEGIFKMAEEGYFKIILYSQVICLFRTAIENYYIGIQQSACILRANIYGLVTNAIFSYIFVLGPLGNFFELGEGAAWGTFVSNLLSSFYLFWLYLKEHGILSLKYNPKDLLKSQDMIELTKQGTYIGLEKFVNSFCFVFFVNLFVVYGHEVSSSISTVFSWDQISYLPMLGVYSAVVSIFSKYLGEQDYSGAQNSLISSLKMSYLLMAALTLLFYFGCDVLTGAFLKGSTEGLDLDKLYFYARVFFKTTAFNIFATATSMLFKAALRSLGYSLWCFITSLSAHLVLCVISYICVYKLKLGPLSMWWAFLVMLLALGLIFAFKYERVMKRLKSNELKSLETL